MFWHILRQNPSKVLGCSELQEPPKKPKKLTRFGAQSHSHMRGNDTPGRIVTNFCTGVGVHDVITCADLYYDRSRGLGVAGVKFWLSPLTCFVALTTLSHYRVQKFATIRPGVLFPRMRDFAHQNVLVFFGFLGFLQLATAEDLGRILTQKTPKHAVPLKDVPFWGREHKI